MSNQTGKIHWKPSVKDKSLILFLIFFLTLLEFVNLRQLSQKSHCSPGKSSYQLQLTSGKFSQVFQAILGAVATGMCHVPLNYLQGWI